MKIKAEFVTNSSSASFIILKENLSDLQINMIYEHIEIGRILAKEEGIQIYPQKWIIEETLTEISGDTGMDNFDMKWFLERIGVKDEHIKYEHS